MTPCTDTFTPAHVRLHQHIYVYTSTYTFTLAPYGKGDELPDIPRSDWVLASGAEGPARDRVAYAVYTGAALPNTPRSDCVLASGAEARD